VLAGERDVRRLVENDEHALEAAADAIRPPVLRQLHGGALEIAAELFELRLESGKERKGIGSRSRKAREDPVVVEAADFPGALLDHGLSEGDLAVTGEHGAVAVSHGKDGRAVNHRFL